MWRYFLFSAFTMCSSLMSVIHSQLIFYLLCIKSVSRFLHFPCGYHFINICWKKKRTFFFILIFVPLLQISWVNLEDCILTCYFLFLLSLLTYSFTSNIVSGSPKLYSNALKWVNFKLSFNIMFHILFPPQKP